MKPVLVVFAEPKYPNVTDGGFERTLVLTVHITDTVYKFEREAGV